MQGEGTSHEAQRWKLVEELVTNFNKYQTQFFSPLDLICADEYISWWYVQGGHWIKIGLPMYVKMERKSENGAEIHNATCGMSGIMIQLRIVQSARNEEDQEDD